MLIFSIFFSKIKINSVFKAHMILFSYFIDIYNLQQQKNVDTINILYKNEWTYDYDYKYNP